MKLNIIFYEYKQSMLQQLMRERRARGGYWKNKNVRVMTSYHEDPTKRFYKYLEIDIWVPTIEEQIEEKNKIEEIMNLVREKEYKKNHPTSFSFSVRYPHPY
jgi:hypothetical protein